VLRPGVAGFGFWEDDGQPFHNRVREGLPTYRDLPVDTRAFPGTNPLEAGFRA
jgi:hypothetical protein